MRALTFHGPGDVRVERVADPAIVSGGDAIVRVRRAAICGSDLHPYRGRETGLDPGTVLGHELVGEVVATGCEVGGVAAGDLVVSPFTTSCGACFFCRGGLTARCERGQLLGWVENGLGLQGAQAELVRVPLAQTTLLPLPPGLDPELALLAADVVPTGLFAADLGAVAPGATIAVLGCGPVGLAAIAGALARGAERVFAFDPVPERRGLAECFGATAPAPAEAAALLREATAGRGADAVLEAVGTREASRMALDLVRPGGTLAAVGVHTEAAFAFAPGEAYDRNLTYRAGRCPARRYAGEALALLAAGRFPFGALFTHRLALDDGPRGYQLFDGKLDGCVKVVLEL